MKPDIVAPGAATVSSRPFDTTVERQYPNNRVPFTAYFPACTGDVSTNQDYFQMRSEEHTSELQSLV